MNRQYGDVIEEGLRSLEKALELEPEYDDAMSYINLLYRARAGSAATKSLADDDVAQAEEWSSKSLDMKRIKAARTPKQ